MNEWESIEIARVTSPHGVAYTIAHNNQAVYLTRWIDEGGRQGPIARTARKQRRGAMATRDDWSAIIEIRRKEWTRQVEAGELDSAPAAAQQVQQEVAP